MDFLEGLYCVLSCFFCCGGLTLGEHHVPTKLLYYSPSHLDKGRENICKALVSRRRWGENINYCHGQNRLNLGKLI